MVYQGESETEKLPNAAVEVLREKYILRADIRPSGTWYELAHDRLVEPILADNLEWRANYKNPIADALERGPDNLLTGSALVDALRYAKENPGEPNPEEQQFLQKSEIEAKKAKVRRRTAVANRRCRNTGVVDTHRLGVRTPAKARSTANEDCAVECLGGAGGNPFGTGLEQEESLDRAIRAFGVADTPEAREAVARAFPSVAATGKPRPDEVYSAAFSPDGQRIVTASADKTARVWNAATGQLLANAGRPY